MSRRRKAAAVLGAVASLVAAAAVSYAAVVAVSYAAVPERHYSGRTSQRRLISFVLAGRFIKRLDYHLYERCPGGRQLLVHDSGFPPIAISQHRFGGTFTSKRPDLAIASVSGKIAGKLVSGSVANVTKDGKTHKTCSGRATFKLTHR